MSFMAEINKIPPVTRSIVAATVAVSLPLMLELVSPYPLLFVPGLVVKKLQLWRLPTSFFMGGSGLGFLFDLMMLYRNSDGLESSEYRRRSADYAWQLSLAALALVLANLPLNAFVHYRQMLVMITYLSSYLAPSGSTTSLFGIVSVPVKSFPFFLVAMDFLSGGTRSAAQSISGCIVGHVWWWIVWERRGAAGGHGGGSLARAPAWLSAFFKEEATGGSVAGNAGNGPIGSSIGGVTAIPGRKRAEAGGASTSGYQWGSGNKLGK